MKRKGFTLVELLAVIAILAILVIIALPNVMSMFNNAKKSSFETEVKQIYKLSLSQWMSDNFTSGNEMIYSKCEDGCENEIKSLDARNNLNYYVKVNGTGKITELYVTDGTYQYEYKGDELKPEEIKEIETIAELDESETVNISKIIDDAINPKYLFNILENEAIKNGDAIEYLGLHNDGFSTPTHKIYHWKAKSDSDALRVSNKNNVLFAGFCWKILRTTDTGGIKLMYNGIDNNNTCDEKEYYAFSSVYNSKVNSPAYVGYMYNKTYTSSGGSSAPTDVYYGSSVNYSNGKYTLINPVKSLNQYHKYTCFSTSSTGTCSSVKYYFLIDRNNKKYYYINLTNGENVSNALYNMFRISNVNTTQSSIKIALEKWFENNLLNYKNYLEDTAFCYDRTYTSTNNGWSPNGLSTVYLGFENSYNSKTFYCNNILDRFSTINSNAKIKYPIGLPIVSELSIGGNMSIFGKKSYMTASYSAFNYLGGSYVTVDNGYGWRIIRLNVSSSVRPVISIKANQKYISGNGSLQEPYIIK